METWGALDAFGEGDEKYSMIFGTNIIASIPAGSIYFGGTEAGQFIITALQKSQVQADPFFTLSQSALADARYLEYLRGMYGTKIYMPTDEDSKKPSRITRRMSLSGGAKISSSPVKRLPSARMAKSRSAA